MILNITYPEKSQVEFQISRFPDGQQTLDIRNPHLLHEKLTRAGNSLKESSVTINSRLNDFKDLEVIICANQALKELGITNIHLYTPYFLGARSDRKFQDGGINYLKTVICPIINSQDFKTVTVLDPHSDVLEACLNNFKKISNIPFAYDVINHLNYTHPASSFDSVLVSPDAGALKKVFKIQQTVTTSDRKHIDTMIIGSKNRDLDGNITHTSIDGPSDLDMGKKRTFIIFDDICDGGRTFIELAKAIREKYIETEVTIVLAITHGIFTKGISPIMEHIDYIYTTNSVKDHENDSIIKTFDAYKYQ